MHKGLIYKYTSKTTSKSYIGKALHSNIERRKLRHKYDKINTHFYRARDKYGYDDFHFSIIEDNISEHILSEREVYWISFYDSFRNGYNSTLGGDGGNTYIKRTKAEMIETKAKISKANKGKNNGQSVDITLYNILSKDIKHFDTLTDASRYLGLTRKSVYRILYNKHITKKGWCLYNEGVQTIESIADYKKLIIGE